MVPINVYWRINQHQKSVLLGIATGLLLIPKVRNYYVAGAMKGWNVGLIIFCIKEKPGLLDYNLVATFLSCLFMVLKKSLLIYLNESYFKHSL